MIKSKILALGAIVALGLTSCDTPPARISDELRYRLVVQYEDQDGTNEGGTIVAVRASQTYNYGAGTGGWGGLGCKVNGSAVPITVEGGTVFALLSFNDMDNVATSQCDLIKELFDIPNWDKDGAWVGQWSELSESNRKAQLKDASLPQLIFVPAGMTIREAKPVYRQDFERYGLKAVTASVEVTQASKTPVPPIIKEVLTVAPDEELKERYNVDDTNRFATGLLAADEES